MLYLSRMDPSRDPKKTRLETSEELKRRSLAQLGVKEGEDVVAMEEVSYDIIVVSRLRVQAQLRIRALDLGSVFCLWGVP